MGVVISGSLTQGLEVRLGRGVSVEDVAVGRYVTIQGERRQFFGLITDVRLESLDPQTMPPDGPFAAQVLSGTINYASIKVLPVLSLNVLGVDEGPQPAKTVPAPFSVVLPASQRDVEAIFGQEDEEHFYIGNPLDMETRLCLNLESFVQRSNGIFGKSGSGKTFLTRLVLIGILQKNLAVNLVFDMHNEYGWEGRGEGGRKVKGLKQLFRDRVVLFTLDKESSQRRGVSTDHTVQVGYDDIEAGDIELLQDTLGLTEAAVSLCHRLPQHFGGGRWLERFLAVDNGEGLTELTKSLNEHEGTVRHLRRRLESLKRLPFLLPQARENSVQLILDYLEKGMHVVLEFGRYDDLVAYILVANLLTRRLHDRYREKVEQAQGQDAAPPRPLVITIEEAHRFLSTNLSSQTIFGTIAREMRKYLVTMLVVDQRPSGIDEEVMSQLGSKFCCLLDNERDVDSVLSGAAGRGELKTILSRLEDKQQALCFGHALPVPVVIRVREYGKSYKEFGLEEPERLKEKAKEDIAKLWG